MPLKDKRTEVATHLQYASSGNRAVHYRDTKGHTFIATVLGPGTSSGLKLKLDAYNTVTVKDNVAAATTVKSTNAYFTRW
jgi:hypothetical protein